MSRLMLMIETRPGEAALEKVRSALEAARIASAVIVPGPGGVFDRSTIQPIVAMLQSAGVAALIRGDIQTVRQVRADGVHLGPSDAAGVPVEIATLVGNARAALGKGQIVGAEIADGSRHDAMTAGEAGADYVAFSGADCRTMAAWWAEIFEIPCIAMSEAGGGVADPHEAVDLATTGADFVAVALNTAQTAADIQAVMRAHAAAITTGCGPVS